MHKLVCFLGLFLTVVAVAFGEEKIAGKQHDYDSDKLPEVIKAKAGDSIVLTFNKIKPQDVEECRVTSDNTDIATANEGRNKNFQIIVRSDKKGKAKVGWVLVLSSGITKGHKDQQVEFE